MIELQDITITSLADNRCLLRDFNFILNEWDKVVIIGEEGNGKSTLLKLIYDEKLIEEYCEYTGRIQKRGVKIGYLEQEMNQFWYSKSVAMYTKSMEWGMELTKVLSELRINSEFLKSEKLISKLSGGERLKLRLLKILSECPDVLLLDEPTNDLDIATIEWLEEYINASMLPIIYVSHDETFIRKTANTIIHIEQVHRKTLPKYAIVRMDYDEYIKTRNLNLEKQTKIAQKQRKEYESQQDHWQQIWNKAEHQHQNVSRSDPRLQKKVKSLKAQKRRMDKEANDFLEVPDTDDSIYFHFDNEISVPKGRKVLEFSLGKLEISSRLLAENISLMVTGGEKIAIIGENGLGKTTLLKKILEDLRMSSLKIGYMLQNYEEVLDYEKRPVEYLVTNGDKDEITRAYTYMGSMKFTSDEMRHKIGELSGGQKAKLLILKLLLEQCEVLILDEPTRNFSPLSAPVIRQALSEFGGSIISVSHDRSYINEVCTSIYELSYNGLVKIK